MRAVFFDLDGTLTDSSPGIVRSIQYALTSLGRQKRGVHELEGFIGAPLKEVFATLLKTDDEELPLKALQLYRERYSRKGLFECTAYMGVPEMLSAIGNDGMTLYVVTAKPRIFAERVISHLGLGEHFSRIFGSELDGTHSAKSDLIRYVLEQTRLSPEKVLMVGDRHHDIKGARANGLCSAAVLWGYGSRKELSACKPDMIVEKPKALAEVLTRIKYSPGICDVCSS